MKQAKLMYDRLSDQVHMTQQKLDKIMDLKSMEKLKRVLHQDILDMNNAKVINDYNTVFLETN